jgi:hypothetical protein
MRDKQKSGILLGMQLLFMQQGQPEHDETPQPVNIRVPFLHEPLGLGDAVANVTQALGIQPCTPCQQRKEALNRRFQLNPYRG